MSNACSAAAEELLLLESEEYLYMVKSEKARRRLWSEVLSDLAAARLSILSTCLELSKVTSADVSLSNVTYCALASTSSSLLKSFYKIAVVTSVKRRQRKNIRMNTL